MSLPSLVCSPTGSLYLFSSCCGCFLVRWLSCHIPKKRWMFQNKFLHYLGCTVSACCSYYMPLWWLFYYQPSSSTRHTGFLYRWGEVLHKAPHGCYVNGSLKDGIFMTWSLCTHWNTKTWINTVAQISMLSFHCVHLFTPLKSYNAPPASPCILRGHISQRSRCFLLRCVREIHVSLGIWATDGEKRAGKKEKVC